MTLDWSFVPGIDLDKEPTVTRVNGGELREWPGCRIFVPDALGEVGPAEAKGDGCRSHHDAPQETVEAILDRLWPKIAECRTAKALGAAILAAGVEVKTKHALGRAARNRLGATWSDQTIREMLKPAVHSAAQDEKRRERNRHRVRAWRADPNNAARDRECSRAWLATNPEYKNDYNKHRLRNDPVFAVAKRLRNRLCKAVQAAGTGKVGKTFDLIDLSPSELAAHLERHFLPGMSWENRHLWDVDHVTPMAAFDLEDPEQQVAAMHWTNLRPLWKTENAAKGSLHAGTRHRHRKLK